MLPGRANKLWNEAYNLTRCKQAEEAPKRYRDFIRTWREEPKALQVFAHSGQCRNHKCSSSSKFSNNYDDNNRASTRVSLGVK